MNTLIVDFDHEVEPECEGCYSGCEDCSPEDFDYEDVPVSFTIYCKPFRPSDWRQRLCSVASDFDPSSKRFQYSNYLKPVGDNAIQITPSRLDAATLKHVVDFIEGNDLEDYVK